MVSTEQILFLHHFKLKKKKKKIKNHELKHLKSGTICILSKILQRI